MCLPENIFYAPLTSRILKRDLEFFLFFTDLFLVRYLCVGQVISLYRLNTFKKLFKPFKKLKLTCLPKNIFYLHLTLIFSTLRRKLKFFFFFYRFILGQVLPKTSFIYL